MYNNNSPITKELYLLLFNIYTYQEPDSSNIILYYYNKLKTMYSLQIQQDPYHFFFYFLDLVHLENNNPPNKEYNFNQN